MAQNEYDMMWGAYGKLCKFMHGIILNNAGIALLFRSYIFLEVSPIALFLNFILIVHPSDIN